MGWIPVTEKLPEQDGFYNVKCNTDSKKNPIVVHSFWFEKGRWCFDNDMTPGEPLFTAGWYVEVIEWQPLPSL